MLDNRPASFEGSHGGEHPFIEGAEELERGG